MLRSKNVVFVTMFILSMGAAYLNVKPLWAESYNELDEKCKKIRSEIEIINVQVTSAKNGLEQTSKTLELAPVDLHIDFLRSSVSHWKVLLKLRKKIAAKYRYLVNACDSQLIFAPDVLSRGFEVQGGEIKQLADQMLATENRLTALSAQEGELKDKSLAILYRQQYKLISIDKVRPHRQEGYDELIEMWELSLDYEQRRYLEWVEKRRRLGKKS